MGRTGFTPCDYDGCDRSPSDGWALHRVNPKGEMGIFMCSEHADEIKSRMTARQLDSL